MVVRSGLSASTLGGRAVARADLELADVGADDRRLIAAARRDDFLAQPGGIARPLVGTDQLRTNGGWGELERTAVPSAKSPFADARLAVFAAPLGEDLVFTHVEAPMSAQGPVSLGRWRAVNTTPAGMGGPDTWSRTGYRYRVDLPLLTRLCTEASRRMNAARVEAVRANPA